MTVRPSLPSHPPSITITMHTAGSPTVICHPNRVAEYTSLYLAGPPCSEDPEFSTRWIRDHIEDAAQKLKKPLLLEEFGKKLGRCMGCLGHVVNGGEPHLQGSPCKLLL
jgi:hypothetical protein